MQETVGSRICGEVAQIAMMATFHEAVQVLQASTMTTLYVIDREEHLCGLLPDYVLVKALLHNAGETPDLASLMCTTPTVLRSDTTMTVAAPLFREARFDSLPVTEDDRLIGELRRSDVINWLLERHAAADSDPASETTVLKGPAFLKRPIPSRERFDP